MLARIGDAFDRAVCAHPRVLVAALAGAAVVSHIVDVKYNGATVAQWVWWGWRHKVLRHRAHPRSEVQAFLTGKHTVSVPQRVSLEDCDLYGHMGNARYLRACDFARIEALQSIGFFDAAFAEKTAPVLAAAAVRFRVELGPLTRYTIRMRCVGYDGVSLYLESLFVAPGRKDGRPSEVLHAAVWQRCQLTRRARLAPVLRRLGLSVGEETMSAANFDEMAGVAVNVPAECPPPDDVARMLSGIADGTDRCKAPEYFAAGSGTLTRSAASA